MSVFLDLFANELLNQKKKVEDKTDLEVENINSDLKYGLLEEVCLLVKNVCLVKNEYF